MNTTRTEPAGDQATPLGAAAGVARQVGDDVKAEVGRLRDEAVAGASRQVEEGKDAGRAYLHTVATAVNSGAEAFRRDGRDGTGAFLDRAADEIASVADRLADRGPGEIFRDVEGFARRHPAVFFGTAFVLAFGAARLLKSSAPASQPERTPVAAGTAPGATSIGMPPDASATAATKDAGTTGPGPDAPDTTAPRGPTPETAASRTGAGVTATPAAPVPRPAGSGPATPGSATLGPTTPDTPTPGPTSSGAIAAGPGTSGQATPGQTTPGQTTPGQTTPGQTTPGQTTPGQTTSGPTTPHVGMPATDYSASRKEIP